MTMTRTRPMTARQRWAIASRVLAATCGGYALAAVSSTALAYGLPLIAGISRAQGVLVATLLSFVIYTVAALAVFCARSATRAWAGLTIITLCSTAIAWAARAAV